MKLQVGQRVRNGAQGPLFNVSGTVVKTPRRGQAEEDGGRKRVWIRWDGNVLSNGYLEGHPVLQQLTTEPADRASTTRVAQAISRAIDEAQESEPLYLDDGPDHEGSTLRIQEVSAELQNASNGLTSIFQVHTSDGQVWDVRITPGKN